MTWISPAATSITSASLSITAFGLTADFFGPKANVYADGNFLGHLNPNDFLLNSTTLLTINPLWLNDGLLNIIVIKNNHISITTSSTLTMNYEGASGSAPTATPEPSSILLMASGLAGLGLYGHRKMALATTNVSGLRSSRAGT